ncbi:SNF2 helicase associated domain-containing protein [Haloimpatiens sp. FM7330]|uniref:SNF2 helicase associated domain-containing protein n=1 Tax=Haloimpatiens sp. FM7330 TaxID=3298610 RepID=UPI00363FA664
MILISKEDIKDITNDIIFKRGEKYYKKDKIKHFNIETYKHDSLFNEIHKIHGLIEGSNGELYNTTVLMNGLIGISDLYCDCMSFHNYASPCKHIIALLLYYINNGDKFINNIESTELTRLINDLKLNLSEETAKTELAMDVILTVDYYDNTRSYIVELKVGEKQKYVVRNIKEFLQVIQNKSYLKFGKNFTYDYYKHKFNETDQKIINLLIELYELDQSIFDDYYKYKLINGKYAYLSNSQFKRLLLYLKDIDFQINIFGKKIINPKIITEQMPLTFAMYADSKTDKIKITQLNNLPIPITNFGEFFLYDGNIYFPNEEQSKFYKPFYDAILHKKELAFDKDNINQINNCILPSMRKITKTIKIDDKIKDTICNEPLKTSIYLDKLDEYITADVLFEYGETKINSLIKSESNTKKIIVRNIDKEQNILDTLKNFGFTNTEHQYILKKETDIIDFLYEGVNNLNKICDIFYSENLKKFKIYSSSNINSSIRINENDLLEFSFNIDDINKKEFKDIFDAIKTKKKYHKLKDGGFILLNSFEFADFVNTIDYLGIKKSDLSKDKILLPKYNSIYLNEKFKNNKIIQVEKNKKFRDTINNIKEIPECDFKAPEYIDNILRGYQKIGFKWFKTLSTYGFGGILADEMGLGKTIQAIAFIASRENTSKENKPVLVVCPSSLVYNWESEIQKFAPTLKTEVISGIKEIRLNKLQNVRKNITNIDVLITSYPLIRMDIDEYKNIEFSYCFIDEAQHIKNPNSLTAQSVKEIRAEGYFALTGTPIENTLTELWSIFDFIMPGYLLSHSKFKKLYGIPITKNDDKKALDELNKHIKPFILRRRKKDVIKELPPKIEHKIVIDLCDEQKKLYASYVSNFKKKVEKEISENGFNNSKIKILSLLTRLRQLCCDPSIFIENYKGESSKINTLLDILENSFNEGHRVLVFSQFTSILKNIQTKLDNKNIKYMYLDGSTKSEDRLDLVNKFNNGKTNVFLISLKAGGTGLNLTGADTVIHFDPWWNPAVEEQASDRAHRIGQNKSVEVIKLITKGTIEEKINMLQEKKKNIFDNVMKNSSEQNMLAKMNEEDIKELFNV